MGILITIVYNFYFMMYNLTPKRKGSKVEIREPGEFNGTELKFKALN